MITRRVLFSVAIVLILALALGGQAMAGSGPDQTPERKIVVFQREFRNLHEQEAILARFGSPSKALPIINGWAIAISPALQARLGQLREVARIDDDVEVYALPDVRGTSARPAPQPTQTLPWGVDRIDAELAWASSLGASVKVAVIDTGIDLTHSDLKANIKGGYNAINPSKSANDDNGHGTHVAGTIAAQDNSIGVVGVAPAASLYAVKVLNRNGSGYLSDVIEGIQWAISNGMQVANMSLGWGSDVQSVHDAIIAAYNANMVIVAAAGNSGPGDNTVGYPAKYSEVIAVSATCGATNPNNWCPGGADSLATFSSRGAEVELAAPGVDIRSTWKGGAYSTISGTSMAAPHVAGTAALVIAANAGITNTAVRTKLDAAVTDLGAAGRDSLFGYGLVNALASVAP